MNVGVIVPNIKAYVYVKAPLGVIVKVSPSHILPLLTVNVGLGLTDTVQTIVFELEQPVTV